MDFYCPSWQMLSMIGILKQQSLMVSALVAFGPLSTLPSLIRKHPMKLKLVICLLVSASVNACGSPNPRWSEEVQSSDGRVIVVERETLNESGGDEWAYNRAGVKPKEYRIRFAILNAFRSTVEWRSTKKSSQTWPEIPLVFDIENGRPVVYAIVHVNLACEIYLKYRYEEGRWTELRRPDQFEQRTTNLLFTIGTEMPKLAAIQEKRASNAEAGTGSRCGTSARTGQFVVDPSRIRTTTISELEYLLSRAQTAAHEAARALWPV